MSNIDDYKENINVSLDKLQNNSNYFEHFGNIYIPQKLKSYIDEIIIEVKKVQTLVNDLKTDSK